MDLGIAGGDLALLALALLAGGLTMGFLSGLFGIGGGGVIVPVLYELFRLLEVPSGIRMQLAVGTSLAVIVPTSLRSLAAHRARGAVDAALVRRLAPTVVVGVLAGILIARNAPGELFKAVWVGFSALMVAKLTLGREDWRLGPDIPASKGVEAYGIVVGFLSTLLSIGGGAFVSGLMTFYGRPITQAVGTSSAFGPIIAVPGTLGFMWAGWGQSGLPPLSLGYVSLVGLALLVPASVIAAPYGVRAAHGVPRRRLELLFALFLAIVGLRFLASLALG